MRGEHSRNNHTEAGPVVMKAVRRLRRQILSGRLIAGMLLPSVRELAGSAGIGLVTAYKALQHAEAEGWAQRAGGGRRLRVAATAPRLARSAFEHEPPSVVYWVIPAERRLQAEARLAGLSEGLQQGLPFASSRYLFLDSADGAGHFEDVLREQARSSEVGCMLLSLPTRLKRLFKNAGVPCVILGDVDPELNLPNVFVDQRKIGLLAGGLLCPAGRVVTLCGEQLVGGEAHLITGVSDAARLLDGPIPKADRFYCMLPGDPVELLEKIDQLLASPDRPAGILATRPAFAVATLRSAARAGLRIPRDLQLLGVPHHPLFEFCYPQISSIGAVSDAEMGRRAAELLADAFLSGAERMPTVEIEPTVIERESTLPRQKGTGSERFRPGTRGKACPPLPRSARRR